MIGNNIELTLEDLNAIQMLDEFLPGNIFNVHMHIRCRDICPHM